MKQKIGIAKRRFEQHDIHNTQPTLQTCTLAFRNVILVKVSHSAGVYTASISGRLLWNSSTFLLRLIADLGNDDTDVKERATREDPVN